MIIVSTYYYHLVRTLCCGGGGDDSDSDSGGDDSDSDSGGVFGDKSDQICRGHLPTTRILWNRSPDPLRCLEARFKSRSTHRVQSNAGRRSSRVSQAFVACAPPAASPSNTKARSLSMRTPKRGPSRSGRLCLNAQRGGVFYI